MCLYWEMMTTHFELKTRYGSVYWTAFPVENHLNRIFAELSSASGMAISRADMKRTPEGRPEFPDCGFDANWTHSKDVCVLAYSFQAKVGVDIEKLRPRALRIAERFFAKDEIALLLHSGLSPEDSLRQFYRIWCRKEALFKCSGGSFLGKILSQSVLLDNVGETFFYDINLPVENPFAATIAVAPNR